MKIKPLRKVIVFYSQEDRLQYRKFCEYIGGRSEQGVLRALISHVADSPDIMKEVCLAFDTQALSNGKF